MSGVDFSSTTLKVFYVCLALLMMKILAMSALTARMRIKKKVVITPEDKVMLKNSKVSMSDVDVERIRRAHRNDLENILIFTSSAFFYSLINPNPALASLLFIIYTIARYAHTYVYAINVKPQPSRFVTFSIGYGINLFMLGSVVHYIGFV